MLVKHQWWLDLEAEAKAKAAGTQKVNDEVSTDKGKNTSATIAMEAEVSLDRAPSPADAVGTHEVLDPTDTEENEKGSGINNTDKGKSLFASAMVATDADASLARANNPPAETAEIVGGSAREADTFAHIRAPRPARRDYTMQEGSVKQWDTPWNQQSPPPPPSQPQVPTSTSTSDLSSLFPPDFPRFHSIHSLNDFGAYLANASYMVSVGGPPLTDIKYGIILVPAGEERLLFGQQPDSEASNQLKEAVRHPRKRNAPGLHDLDKDSEEFLRRRNVPRAHNTESAAASVYSAGIGRQTTEYPVKGADEGRAENAQARRNSNHSGDMQVQPTKIDGTLFLSGQGDTAMSEEAGPAVVQGHASRPAANKKREKQAAASLRTASKPQGVVKNKSSTPRKKTVRAETLVGQPTSTVTRALRSRGAKK